MEAQKRIIDAIFGDHIRHRNEFLYFCPICHHHKQKLSINFDKNTFKCWVCEYAGFDIFKLVKRFGTYEQTREFRSHAQGSNVLLQDLIFSDTSAQKRPNVITKLPVEYQFLSKSRNKRALQYLYDREVTIDDIYKWKIGFCESGKYWDRIMIPSFNANGVCNFFSARSINDKHQVPYLIPDDVSKNDIIFNELNIDWNEEVYLIEGSFDAMKLQKSNVIPLMGKTLSPNSELMRKLCIYNPVVNICLDTDRTIKGYVNRSIKLAKQLMSFGIDDIFIVSSHPYKDFGDVPKKQIPNFLQKRTKIFEEIDLLFQEIRLMEETL